MIQYFSIIFEHENRSNIWKNDQGSFPQAVHPETAKLRVPHQRSQIRKQVDAPPTLTTTPRCPTDAQISQQAEEALRDPTAKQGVFDRRNEYDCKEGGFHDGKPSYQLSLLEEGVSAVDQSPRIGTEGQSTNGIDGDETGGGSGAS